MNQVNNWVKALFILGFVMMLSGCGTDGLVCKTDTDLIVVPDTLTTPVRSEPPPDVKTYLALPFEEREKVWKEAFKKQTLNVENANLQFKNIEQWKKDQQAIWNKQRARE